ncbi:MAG: hypothetical protein ACI4LM_00645 [Anaerovoracaceae bacterium]
MIKIYIMKSCPYCAYIVPQVRARSDFKLIDIGEDIRDMKTFIRLRDNDPVFDEVKKEGRVGVPCFVREDGSVTLRPEAVGLKSGVMKPGAACSIDGTGC